MTREEIVEMLEESRILGNQVLDAVTRGTPKTVTCLAIMGIARTLKHIAPEEWAAAKTMLEGGEKGLQQ